MYKIIIAIDGYSACGKSTTAKKVAENLRYTYVDTGAMYRAVTLYILDNHIPLANTDEVAKALDEIDISFRRNLETLANETFLNGKNVEQEIRKMPVSDHVSQVSAIPEVRRLLVSQQQRMGKDKGLVMDGRDIGSVVFPQAELKVFMTADVKVRALRRQSELAEKGEIVPLEEILENLRKRDLYDTTRQESPLIQAEDAILLDNTYLTIDEQVDLVTSWADARIASLSRKGETQNRAH